jgi:hypothetical protein
MDDCGDQSSMVTSELGILSFRNAVKSPNDATIIDRMYSGGCSKSKVSRGSSAERLDLIGRRNSRLLINEVLVKLISSPSGIELLSRTLILNPEILVRLLPSPVQFQ